MKLWIGQVLLRASLAVLVGALIGNERARHGRAAGMRTHILVCLGACMTSMTGMFVSQCLGVEGDVFRISAQVISGVGFLGAGMIILKNNNVVTGLTTAAGVWTTATIGVALGYGFYVGAAVAAALLLITIVVFARFERRRKSAEVIYLELDDPYRVNETIRQLKDKIPANFSFQIFAPKTGHVGHVGLNLVIEKHVKLEAEELCAIPGVVFAVEE